MDTIQSLESLRESVNDAKNQGKINSVDADRLNSKLTKATTDFDASNGGFRDSLSDLIFDAISVGFNGEF